MSGDGNKPNILIVHNHYQIPGGEDTVVANEKQMLEKYGHKVILYMRHNSELKKMSRWQKLALPFRSVFNKKTYDEVKRIIREQQVEIVHVHNTLNLISPAVYYAAVACKTPVVQTIHNFRLLCPGAAFYRDGHICEECLEKGLFHSVKYGCYRENRLQTFACAFNIKIHRMTGIYKKLNYICLTEFNREKLLFFQQIAPERVSVKPNFIESIDEEVIPSKKRDERFIFVGRLEKLKGVDILLQAWKIMGDSAPRLTICGNGPMEAWCKDYVRKHRLYSVEMKGFVPNVKARKLVASSKALILPTRCYEGFPMTIVEAFSVGTPVITSDLGNARDLVEEGVTGCKFTADSPEELVRAMTRIDKYPDIYITTANKYNEKYTEARNYECLMRIYRKTDWN